MRRIAVGLTVGLVLAFGLSGDSQRRRALAKGVTVRGAGEATLTHEQLEWAVGKGARRRIVVARTVIKIPASYGQLIEIASGPTGQVLWYQDAAGRLRNVLIDPEALVRVHQE